MRILKTSTSMYLSDHKKQFPMFNGWGKSYCALTYSLDHLETVKHYIMNQKEHHKKTSFRDELHQLLLEHGVQFDEKYFLADD